MPKRSTNVCFACGKQGHLARTVCGQYVCGLVHNYGPVVAPDHEGRCGHCGAANFRYSNGQEYAADGTRGYRCVVCGAIKDERWRESRTA
jgi:hypothetical protein